MHTLLSYLLRGVILAVCSGLSLAGQNYTFETFVVPNPARNGTSALGINNRGAVVGRIAFNVRDSLGNTVTATRGFKRFAGGAFEFPIIAPGDADFFTDALGINNFGVIVGRYRDAPGNFHGFILDQEKFSTVDVGGGPNTWVTGINESGDYVGVYGPQLAPENGFVSSGGKISTIARPGATSTVPYGIAADGSIVGYTFQGPQNLIFIRGPQGKFQTFHIPNADTQLAYSINNNAHLVVGYYVDNAAIYHGFTYDYLASGSEVADGASVPVNTVDYPGAIVTEVTGVNGKGEISGYAILPSGSHFSFIGTPVK